MANGCEKELGLIWMSVDGVGALGQFQTETLAFSRVASTIEWDSWRILEMEAPYGQAGRAALTPLAEEGFSLTATFYHTLSYDGKVRRER